MPVLCSSGSPGCTTLSVLGESPMISCQVVEWCSAWCRLLSTTGKKDVWKILWCQIQHQICKDKVTSLTFFFPYIVELPSDLSGPWDVPCFKQLAQGSSQSCLFSWKPQLMWIKHDVSESRNNTVGCRAFPPCWMPSRNTMCCLSRVLRACWRVGWGVKDHLQGIRKSMGQISSSSLPLLSVLIVVKGILMLL